MDIYPKFVRWKNVKNKAKKKKATNFTKPT